MQHLLSSVKKLSGGAKDEKGVGRKKPSTDQSQVIGQSDTGAGKILNHYRRAYKELHFLNS